MWYNQRVAEPLNQEGHPQKQTIQAKRQSYPLGKESHSQLFVVKPKRWGRFEYFNKIEAARTKKLLYAWAFVIELCWYSSVWANPRGFHAYDHSTRTK